MPTIPALHNLPVPSLQSVCAAQPHRTLFHVHAVQVDTILASAAKVDDVVRVVVSGRYVAAAIGFLVSRLAVGAPYKLRLAYIVATHVVRESLPVAHVGCGFGVEVLCGSN
jgi:hypothetical protein